MSTDSFKKLCNNINTTNDLSADETLKSTPLNQLKIMGSYASYSSSGSYYAVKTSLDILQKNILLQNRFLHLDVDFKVKGGEKIPIVKSEKNPEHLLFDDCCETIQNNAWSSSILGHYPLFLFIYLRYDSINIDVSNKVADILIKYFSDNWPDIKYKNGFQDGNLATENLENFMNKVVIFTNYTNDDVPTDTQNNTPRDNTPRDNGFYLNELTHSYIKIYKNYIDILNDSKVNFAALNYNNRNNNNELSMNQYNDFSKNKEQLKDKFLIIFPNYNNSKSVTDTYSFNIKDDYTSLVNIVSMIQGYSNSNSNSNSKLFDLLLNYIKFFTITNIYMPIRPLIPDKSDNSDSLIK
jgi:hypothetical protein